MRIFHTYTIKIIFAALFIALFAVACGDSTTSTEFPEPEIVGFSLQIEGVEIVRYQSGQYTFNTSGNVSEFVRDDAFILSTTHNGGNLVRTSAEEENISSRRYFTVPLGIQFIMDDGTVLTLPEERVQGASGDVSGDELNPEGFFRLNVEWTEGIEGRKANIEQHGSDQSWRFHIRADYEGTLGMTVRVDSCDDVVSLESIEGENTRVNQVRNCASQEEIVFRASNPLPIVVEEYELTDESGKYPHIRHERIR